MEAIQNRMDSVLSLDRYHLSALPDSQMAMLIEDAVSSGDLPSIDSALQLFALGAKSSIFAMGMICVIVDREGLYKKGGYRSYLDYLAHVSDFADIPVQTISDAKRIAEIYLNHFQKLAQVKFVIDRNAHKLRFLDSAIEAHGEEAYRKIGSLSLREFQKWAYSSERSDESQQSAPYNPPIEVYNDQIRVAGAPVLVFDSALPEEEKKFLGSYLDSIYRIRQTGNVPFLLETYDEGEQRAILNFQKRYRAKK